MAYTSDKRLYLDADGNVVEDEATAATLLVGEGGELDDATAEKYGLTGKAAKAEAKAVTAPAETKAVSKAPANK